MKKVIGHTRQREALARLVRSEQLPSALLFLGTEGTGKQLVARELFSLLLCENHKSATDNPLGGCGKCKPCLLIEHGNHPDLHVVECTDHEEWSVSRFREFLGQLQFAPFAGRHRAIERQTGVKIL